MGQFYNYRFALLALLLFSCSQNTRESQLGEKGGKDSLATLASSSSENFHHFLDKFSNEEFFQLKRIVFPIKITIPDMHDEGMAPMEETIGKYDWEMLDLTYDSTYAERDYDQYLQNIVFSRDTAVVELRGIDNGIYADYYFKLIGDKWFLVTLTESSF